MIQASLSAQRRDLQENQMHKIDHTKGQMVGTVSAQWASRPDDQKFLSLSSLKSQVSGWREASYTKEVVPRQFVLKHDLENASALNLEVDGLPASMTHFGFQQLCWAAKTPADYMRRLPPALAALNVNYGLKSAQQKAVSAYVMSEEATMLRGITSPSYGRIYDEDVVDAVMKIAGDGTGDTRWKVPGCIDWGSEHGVSYNPMVDITKENTTLYASDRDIFLFLVDDLNPIEVGLLNDGSPDLMFRGFYVWNSEVGQRTFGVATMYLRGVCQNRCLWGIEQFTETVFKHTSGAPEKFVQMAAPALESFTEGSTAKVIGGVKAAKAAKVSVTDEERVEFLAKFGFSEKQAKLLITRAVGEEGKPPETIWDHAQAVSAQARTEPLQEKRLAMEQIAGKMLDKIAA
jgi:hypothetical protein